MSYSRSYSCGADPYGVRGVQENPPPYTPSAEWPSYPADTHTQSFGPIHNPVSLKILSIIRPISNNYVIVICFWEVRAGFMLFKVGSKGGNPIKYDITKVT